MDVPQSTGIASSLEYEHPYAKLHKELHKDATLPPPATYDDTHEQRGRTPRGRAGVIACCSIFLMFFFTLSLIILVYWLILQPKEGSYNLVDSELNLFNLTQVEAQYELDADIGLNITFCNPNDNMGFDIKGINVHALYAGEEIGQTALPPFYQPRKNDTNIATKISVAKRLFSDTVGGALHVEVERSNIALQVVMDTEVRNNHGQFASLNSYHSIRMTCFVNLMAPRVNGTAPGVMINKRCAMSR